MYLLHVNHVNQQNETTTNGDDVPARGGQQVQHAPGPWGDVSDRSVLGIDGGAERVSMGTTLPQAQVPTGR
jgi:hypothetical protein